MSLLETGLIRASVLGPGVRGRTDGNVGSVALHSGCECPNFQRFLHCMSFEVVWVGATLRGREKRPMLSSNSSTSAGRNETTREVVNFLALTLGLGWRKRTPWIGVLIVLIIDSNRQG